MSEIGENLKNIVMKGIEVIGNKAGNIASTARQKVGEFNLANDQKELFSLIGSKVLELSKQGVEFPEELKEDLKRAAEMGAELDRIRSEKVDSGKTADEKSEDMPEYRETPEPEGRAPAAPAGAAEFTAKDDLDVPVIEVPEEERPEEEAFADCPLSSAINDLFENMPPVDKMMDKVNNSLDELGDSLRKFSGDFGRQLDEFTDQMMGNNDRDRKE